MTPGLLHRGQKFLWDVFCVCEDFLFFLCFFSLSLCFQKGDDHARWTQASSGRRVSKEPFSGGWMGTGDTWWSHPVTICTGSHASYLDRTQMLRRTRTRRADIWRRDKMLNAAVHGMSSGF